jgi:transposase-like protein
MSAKRYTEEERKALAESIILDIAERHKSARAACKKHDVKTSSFLRWVRESEEIANKYMRAMELRQDALFDEIIEIADSQENDVSIDADGNKTINHNIVQRNRLQIDARKWSLAKMNPRKYGDKVDVTTDGEKINQIVPPWMKAADAGKSES